MKGHVCRNIRHIKGHGRHAGMAPAILHSKLNESYVSHEPAKPHPLKTEVYFDIIKVADLDETSNTMTIFVKLWVLWNDTRLTISNLE